MTSIRKQGRNFSSEFKSKVAIEALIEWNSLSKLAKLFELQPDQLLRTGVYGKYSSVLDKKKDNPRQKQVDLDALYAKIGKLEAEQDLKNLKRH